MLEPQAHASHIKHVFLVHFYFFDFVLEFWFFSSFSSRVGLGDVPK